MTTVELFKDIGLYMSMKETIDFTSKSQQNTWFNSKVSKTVTNVAFNKLQNLLHIPMDYGEALEYTYVRFKNLDNSGRIYYYFIHSATLIDDSTVAFQLVLDPLQNFMCEWSIGECMVNRKHCDRWNKNATVPIRVTPNIEGINCYYNTTSSMLGNFVTKDGEEYYFNWVLVGFNYTRESSGVARNELRTLIVPLFRKKTDNEIVSHEYEYIYLKDESGVIRHSLLISGMESLIAGTLFSRAGIDVNNVRYMTIVPFDIFDTVYTTGTYSHDGQSYTGAVIEINSTGLLTSGDDDSGDNYIYFATEYSRKYISFDTNLSKPTKPTNNATANWVFEPALFIEPYMKIGITSPSIYLDGQIPDKYISNSYNSLDFVLALSASQQNLIIYPSVIGSEVKSFTEFNSNAYCEGMLFVAQLNSIDINSNEWLSYCLTQRAEDRQILSNTLINNTVKDALFMGYGGALVGSRGGGLTNIKGIGKAVLPATGLATTASLIGSAVDAHYSWENQNLTERIIRNQPKTVLINGNNGLSNIVNATGGICVTEYRCDSVNFNKAYENFRKYGYEINEWQKPNIRSRKYFDYILTNGAVIDGALNQQIKEEIANVFDNGITIFHADYSDTLTYPTNENIERALL